MKAVHLKRLGEIYQRAGNIKQALVTIRRWKTLSPNDKNVWLAEVEILETVDGPESALESLRKAAQKFEGDSEIYTKLASLNSATGRGSQANLLYWRLYDESEDMGDRIRWAGELARSAQRQGTVEQLVDEFIGRRRNLPKSVAAIMALAEVYRVNNQAEKRRNLLLEATRLRPDDVSLLMQVASMDSRNGANKDAIDILRKAQKLDETGAVTRKLASVLMSEGYFIEAMEELETAAGKSDARMVEDLLVKFIQHRKFSDALSYLKKNLVKFPDDWRLLFLESLILYELGDSKNAAESSLVLLSKNNEIKNIKHGWAADRSYLIGHNLDKSNPMPEKYAKLGLFREAHYTISSFTMNSKSYSRYYGGQQFSSLPRNIKSLHLMASSIFFMAMGDLEMNEQKNLLALAERAGIDDPELTLLIYELLTDRERIRINKLVDIILEKIKEYPENIEYPDSVS